MDDLLRFNGAVRRDPEIDAWFSDFADPFRLLARTWFERMRGCGPDVRELLHDGCPVACVGDAPFGYVNAFKAHASVGFFYGAMLGDAPGFLEGAGKRMRHVKLRPGKLPDDETLSRLIDAAYDDIRRRLALISAQRPVQSRTSADPTAMKATGPSMTSKSAPKKEKEKDTASPSRLIDAKIAELNDWRGAMLARIRKVIRQADPDVVEELKWRGVPVWSHAGIICTGETYNSVVKMTFAKGASLEDPSGLFNASLEGNTRRAIDLREGDKIDEAALKALIRAAVALNTSKRRK